MRGYGWIIYEILSGHYLEALRDMRFLFEGAFLSIHLDYLIDRKVFEKFRALGTIGLKGEIWKLREDLRVQGSKLSSDKQEEIERARRSIRKKVRNYLEKLSLPNEKRKEYEELYIEILSQPELYWSISKIIKEFCRKFSIDTTQINRLKAIWDELSRYTHFSSEFIEIILGDPYFLFVSDFNRELFKKCVELAFSVFDVLCAIIAIYYPDVRKVIKDVLVWWDKNSSRTFRLTSAILENSSDDNLYKIALGVEYEGRFRVLTISRKARKYRESKEVL